MKISTDASANAWCERAFTIPDIVPIHVTVNVVRLKGVNDTCTMLLFFQSIGPGGVQAPFVTVLSSTTMEISWEPPIQHNGELDYYIIKLPSPRFEIRNISQESLIVEDLVPNTVYRVTVTACTRSKILAFK